MPMPLPEFDPNVDYSAFKLLALDKEGRYKMETITAIIRNDDVECMAEVVRLGWIVPESRAFCGETIPYFCDQRKAVKCAAKLRELGFPG